MTTVHVHLVLNHIPPVLLLTALVFLVVGVARSSESSFVTGLRITIAAGFIAIPVAGSGLVSASVLHDAGWLDLDGVSRHQWIGIFAASLTIVLAVVSGVVLYRRHAMSQRVKAGVLALALTALAVMSWAATVGGSLRHTELQSKNVQDRTTLDR